jgi:hypothetical protein
MVERSKEQRRKAASHRHPQPSSYLRPPHLLVRQEDWRLSLQSVRGHRRFDWFPTKTLQPRWAPISDNLAAWLNPYSRPSGSFIPIARNGENSEQRLRNLRERAEKEAELWPWRRNCLRHSYISYRLALTEDVSQVALEAGHDPKTLAAWYRRPITEGSCCGILGDLP